MNGPNLSFLRRPGVREGLLETGMALMAQSDTPHTSVLGNLGRALPYGVQAGKEAAERHRYDQMLEGAPPQMRQFLKMMDPREGAAFMLQAAMAPPPPRDIYEGTEGQFFEAEPGGGFTQLTEPQAEAEPLPSDVRTMQWLMEQPPEVQESYRAMFGPASGTTVNVNPQPTPFVEAIQQNQAALIQTGAQAAEAASSKIGAIDRVIEITRAPAFRNVSGPIWGGRVGELRSQFADDPTARQLAAEFNAIGGVMTMQQLEAFTGPKTDFEFQQAKRLVLNDTNLTPEEIRAGLEVHRRVAIAEALKWANEMRAVDLRALGADPSLVAPQLQLADQIINRYGNNGARDLRTRYGLN